MIDARAEELFERFIREPVLALRRLRAEYHLPPNLPYGVALRFNEWDVPEAEQAYILRVIDGLMKVRGRR